MRARRHRFGLGIFLDAWSITTLADGLGLQRRGCLQIVAFVGLRLGLLVRELELGGIRIKLYRSRKAVAACL